MASARPIPMPGGASRRRAKADVAAEFLSLLRDRGSVDVDAPGFADGIREHFEGLPSRYALDVNIDSLDVLNHKRLLDSARADPSAVSFQVRSVDVVSGADMGKRPSFGSSLDMAAFLLLGGGGGGGGAPGGLKASPARGAPAGRPLPRPAFGSSPNLQALVLGGDDRGAPAGAGAAAFYEVTIASADQPKLLSRLSECLGDLGLNICEAHAFNTKDRFALDVFVVNAWAGGGADELEDVLSARLTELPPPGGSALPGAAAAAAARAGAAGGGGGAPAPGAALSRASPGSAVGDDWELDPSEIVFGDKIASGAFGDLYRGAYCGQDVAIKILRGVEDSSAQLAEFLQEVAIMRKVRHRNVVQFIGACTVRPNLCIVFEFLPGGSVYDAMRRRGAPLRVGQVVKMALEVCRGMDYLHKRKIVHRDLKAANLLLDESGGVKIADFGVSRVLEPGGGVMTAETGTYRWMAPEVIEHAPYDERADVFSFGVVLWELVTGRVPYADMTPLQAAVGVVQKGLRPPVPPACPPPLAEVMAACWRRDPAARPSFEQLKARFEELHAAYAAAGVGADGGADGGVAAAPQAAARPRPGAGNSGGLLARLRAGGGGGGSGKR